MNKQKRRDIGKCLQQAKWGLWDGTKNSNQWFFGQLKPAFICWAIKQTSSKPNIIKETKRIIRDRMNPNDDSRGPQFHNYEQIRYVTLEDWIINHVGPKAQVDNQKLMQAYRHRWLDSLIEEFSK